MGSQASLDRRAWRRLREVSQMRIYPIADLHGHLPYTPPCDLLVIAGDVCPVVDHGVDRQRTWLDADFRAWLLRQPAREKVGIAGNHDFLAQFEPDFMRSLPWVYLQDEATEIAGLKIFGSPWTPTFFNWAFMKDDPELEDIWAAIPSDTQLLITHGPPRGFGDRTRRGVTAGSWTLLKRIQQLKELKLHVFGHIHEDPGAWTYNGVLLINSTYVNLNYEPWDNPGFPIEMEFQ